ncbi:MAG: M48 family metalloprotease, partial [Rhodothermales bacterium]|nr:M48 family metalloprotease [Rhodothermales bacterium]
INAFALPGGFVYVTRGLMAHMENEAQLAVVLGHEIGHVAARHASQRALGQQARQLGVIAGAVGGQALFGGEAAQSILELGGIANQFITLSYSRDAERESDALGVEYAARLGYDATQGAGFFRTLERLGEQSGQEIPGFLSSHPDPGERNETIQRSGAEWAERVGGANVVGREALLERIDGVVYGEDPRQGFVEAGSFNHPSLEFRFPVPSEWQVINQPTQVALVPESQEAYIIMSIDQKHDTAREAAEAFASDQNLTVVQSGVGQAGGLSSRFVVADAQNQDGTELRVRAQFIDYNGNVYVFIGVTTKAAYGTYGPRFVDVMQGFRRLTDSALLAVQPDRVDVRTSGSQATLQQLLTGTLPQKVEPEAVAILNQLRLNDTLVSGQSYKSVR